MPSTVTWEIRGGRTLGPSPFLVAGIVNATPDSFFDGGEHFGTDDAVKHGERLAKEGAHILDVGGESTRPYADEVDAAEEIRRVVPVLSRLADMALRTGGEPDFRTALSVDTYKAETAAAALEAGAEIVNDVSACRFDPGLLDVVAQYQPGYVLMHSPGKPEDMQDDPRYDDVVGEILAFFETRLKALVRAGVPESRIVLDPGVGFGKLLGHNLELLKNVHRFQSLGRPVYMGLSNKSLWGGLLGLDKDDRGFATQTGTALTASKGVLIHRVHDVARTVQTLTITREIG